MRRRYRIALSLWVAASNNGIFCLHSSGRATARYPYVWKNARLNRALAASQR
ncbi:hypothetical protein KCP69_21775 [Salmonella enterica subsp. enterica]|nr:hypothetical protein KCP69_21775 [Salmonella enterica subsp. enterica]